MRIPPILLLFSFLPLALSLPNPIPQSFPDSELPSTLYTTTCSNSTCPSNTHCLQFHSIENNEQHNSACCPADNPTSLNCAPRLSCRDYGTPPQKPWDPTSIPEDSVSVERLFCDGVTPYCTTEIYPNADVDGKHLRRTFCTKEEELRDVVVIMGRDGRAVSTTTMGVGSRRSGLADDDDDDDEEEEIDGKGNNDGEEDDDEPRRMQKKHVITVVVLAIFLVIFILSMTLGWKRKSKKSKKKTAAVGEVQGMGNGDASGSEETEMMPPPPRYEEVFGAGYLPGQTAGVEGVGGSGGGGGGGERRINVEVGSGVVGGRNRDNDPSK